MCSPTLQTSAHLAVTILPQPCFHAGRNFGVHRKWKFHRERKGGVAAPFRAPFRQWGDLLDLLCGIAALSAALWFPFNVDGARGFFRRRAKEITVPATC